LRDGGLAFNISLVPLLQKERKVELIIVVDASDGIWTTGPSELVKAMQWADTNSIPFPRIPEGGVQTTPCIYDGNNEGPSILYVPICSENLAEQFPTMKLNPGDEEIELMRDIVAEAFQGALALLQEWLLGRK